jgi:cell division protein FtsL
MAQRPGALAPSLPQPRLRVIAEPRRRFSAALIPAALVLILAVFAVAALEAGLAQEGFRAAKLEREVRQAEERHAILRAELASLSSPSRLVEVARRLGMGPAPDPVFVQAPGADRRPAGDERAEYASKRLELDPN